MIDLTQTLITAQVAFALVTIALALVYIAIKLSERGASSQRSRTKGVRA